MQILINKNRIVNILSKLQNITSRKNINSGITENILIEAKNSAISIKATDLEISFEGIYSAKVYLEGVISINSKKTYEILKEFPEKTVSIIRKETGRIRIGNDIVYFDIPESNSDKFPKISSINNAFLFQIKAAFFKDMIKKTTIISSTVGEKRAHIIGILFEIINKENITKLRMVSTDAKRLSIIEEEIKNKENLSSLKQVLVPKKGLTEIAKFLDFEEFTCFGIYENQLFVKNKNETLILRLIEGDFPQYKDVLIKGKKEKNLIKLKRNELIKTIKRMSILVNDINIGVTLSLKTNRLICTVKNPEFGESKEEVLVTFSQLPVEAVFNPKFFLDTLNVMKSNFVFLNIVDSTKPCLIEGSEENSFTSIIMPMRSQ